MTDPLAVDMVGKSVTTERPGTLFNPRTVRRHFRKHHPACPDELVEILVAKIVNRSWVKTTLGAAVGIVTTNHVRHEMTQYECLMKATGLSREEARNRVQPE